MLKKFFMVQIFVFFLLLFPASSWAANPIGYQGASQWAIPELDKAMKYGLITDRIKTNMNAPISREELAEIAVKLYENATGETVEASDPSMFVDTTNPEIFKAYSLGIVSGTDVQKRLFSPGILTNREQVAAILYRNINAMGINLDDNINPVNFKDAGQISAYAIESVNYMSAHGFIMGSGGNFDPKGTCTREMAVLITARVYENANPGNDTGIIEDKGENDSSYYDQEADDYSSESDDSVFPHPMSSQMPGNKPSDNELDNSGDDAMRALIPLLNDAAIMYKDEWDGGDGSVFYTTNFSIEKAYEFYRDPALYKEFRRIKTDNSMDYQVLVVTTDGLEYYMNATPNNTGQGGPTLVQVEVFKIMYLDY